MENTKLEVPSGDSKEEIKARDGREENRRAAEESGRGIGGAI